MGVFIKAVLLAGAVLAVFVGLAVKSLYEDAPVPVLQRDVWWGSGEKKPEDSKIQPFQINFPKTGVDELNLRLDMFLKRHIPLPLENVAFQYGFNTDYLRTVVGYWRNKYNWVQRQAYLNSFPQFTIQVNGIKLHFLRVSPTNPEGKRVLPLLLLHGWPGSIREFYDIIPLLTTPDDQSDFVFEVIAPSLPGYGFSAPPAKTGMGVAEMSVVLNNLMEKLGYQKYYAHGGDLGAALVRYLGTLYPDRILGVHSNMCGTRSQLSNVLMFLGSFYHPLVVEKEHEHLVYPFTQKFLFMLEEFGYFHLQATKPDTIGVALGDTPAGLAAYILEKFSTWTNPTFKNLRDGGITKKYDLDTLLDNVMIYWITNTMTSASRLYAESFTFKQMALNIEEVPITVPTACARFAHDIVWTPEKLLRIKFRNLVHISDFPDGGHFPALEMPEALANDIRQAIIKFEKRILKV